MRLVTVVALLTLLAARATAAGVPAAGPDRSASYPGQCRKLEKQIHHFEGMARLADARGDQLWENETRRHIARLDAQRDARCGDETQDDGFAAALWRATRAAGRGALRAFTFGAF